MRPMTVFVSYVLTLSLILVVARQSRADIVHIVSPSAFADTEGDRGGESDLFSPTGRLQQVFLASDFQSLSGIGTITQFALRPDGPRTTPFQGIYPTITIKLSTTSVEVGNLSMTFADNVGTDEAVVLSTTDLPMSSQNLGPAGGPKEFDIIYTFETPFEYDPSLGNLLLEMSYTYEGEFSWDFVNPGSGTQFIGNYDPDASEAAFSTGGYVGQFTVVPEPSTITLFTMAGLIGGFIAWRKRRRT